MRSSSSGLNPQAPEGEKRVLNDELWHACAGPLVSLPLVGSRVVYFPQGHSEQVAASTNKEGDVHIPNYSSLPPQLICMLHNVTMHADVVTDEVYAQMTLQPLNQKEQKDGYQAAEISGRSRQPMNYFCKTLTASDTSTHGGFSVPRRAAEKVFPPLDYSQQPPAQELIARDLHDNEWKFRHIFRGQPKRHLLTTGWSVFVSAKRLIAGDSVLFIWNHKNELLLGIRRSSRPQTNMPLSVMSSDSMHLGLLAAAAHAAATNSRFTIFYNPRASPCEFVIPLIKYIKAVYHTRVSVGMRFRMLFETEESSVRRYMGTITGITELDAVRWPNSHWRSVKVGWDESTAGERQPRVSLWEIEPLTAFPLHPSPFSLQLKRPWPPELPSFHVVGENDIGMSSSFTWDQTGLQPLSFQSVGVSPWMQSRLEPSGLHGLQNDIYQTMAAAAFQDMRPVDPSRGSSSLTPTSLLQPHSTMGPTSEFSSPMCHHQSFSDSNGNNLMGGSVVSPLHTILGNFSQEDEYCFGKLSSSEWSSKRLAMMDSSFQPCGSGNNQYPMDHPLGQSNGNNDSLSSVSLPPFPGRECSIEQEENTDPHSHFLFGVSIDTPSRLMQNEISDVSTGIESATIPFTSSNNEFSSNLAMMTPSTRIDESGYLQSAGSDNPHSTFVKVYMSGTFGRSVDISKFSSYNELRESVGQMFGLGGQLEDDPLRSGWQLVFVDRENDVLLLGDDPWPDFANSVDCIKILSPDEVRQMGKHGNGLELLHSAPASPNPPDADYEDFGNRWELRTIGEGIGNSFEY